MSLVFPTRDENCGLDISGERGGGGGGVGRVLMIMYAVYSSIIVTDH